MKTTRLILALLALPVLASSNLQAKTREIPFIYLNQSKILYITVMDNIYHDGNVADRFYDIEETLVKVLKEVDFPMGYKIVRFGARNVPKDHPELQLVITKWGDNRLGEIEVRLNGVLKETSQGRTRNKLGYFRHADGAFPMVSRTRTTAKYNEVLTKALMQLMARLNDHFTVEFDNPDIGGNTLPPALGTPVRED